MLFERYCLPSLKGQTCKNFDWIVLFDSTTPERYKQKIEEYQKDFQQFVPVFVKLEEGRYFAEVFRDEVVKRITNDNARSTSGRLQGKNHDLNKEWGRVITTYLDNDDALNVRFVEDLQQRVMSLSDGTFVSYTHGYQLYTDYQYMMQIHYPRNHFMSVVERADPLTDAATVCLADIGKNPRTSYDVRGDMISIYETSSSASAA